MSNPRPNKSHSEFNDFCGEHKLNFDNVDKNKVTDLLKMLNEGYSFQHIAEEVFQNNLDQMAEAATYAFSLLNEFNEPLLTREQVTTILEFRSMNNDFKENGEGMQVFNFFDEKGELTTEALSILPSFISSEDQSTFIENLKKKPSSEHCFFRIKISKTYLDENLGVNGLLELSVTVKIINKTIPSIIQREYEKEFGKEENISETSTENECITINIFSTGARNALTKAIYGEHAKSIFPRLGKFTMNDIGRSINNYGRCYSVSYPGIPDETEYHEIKSKSFFLRLHDEVHRRLISTIHNAAYEALISAIKVVRTKTDNIWSKELWDSKDMEIGVFLNENPKNLNTTSPQIITEYFLKLLSATVHTQNRTMGLFTESPFFDTTWLLLIDIALNKETWNNLSINSEYFIGIYKDLYLFVENNIDQIKKVESPAKQVAIIKSQYFNLTHLNLDDYSFSNAKKRALYDEKYIQLTNSSQQTILFNKKDSIQILNNLNYYASNYGQAIDQKLYQSTLKIHHLITNNTLTIDDLNKLMDYQIDALLNIDKIYNALQSNQLTFEAFKKLKSSLIFSLFKKDIITIKDVNSLTENHISVLNHLKSYLRTFHSIQIDKEFYQEILKIYSLVENNKLTVPQFLNFDPEKIEELLNDKIYNLINTDQLPIEKFITLPRVIYAFIIDDLMTIEQFNKISPEKMEFLTHRKFARLTNLVFAKYLSIAEIEDLSDKKLQIIAPFDGIASLIEKRDLTVDNLRNFSVKMLAVIKDNLARIEHSKDRKSTIEKLLNENFGKESEYQVGFFQNKKNEQEPTEKKEPEKIIPSTNEGGTKKTSH